MEGRQLSKPFDTVQDFRHATPYLPTSSISSWKAFCEWLDYLAIGTISTNSNVNAPLNIIEPETDDMGLAVKEGKTIATYVDNMRLIEFQITANNYTFHIVNKFVYFDLPLSVQMISAWRLSAELFFPTGVL